MEKAALPWASHLPRRTVSSLPFLAGTDSTRVCRQAGRQADSQLGAWVAPKVTEHRQSENKGSKAKAKATPSSRQKPTDPRPHLHQGPGPGRATTLPHLRGLQQAEQQQAGEAAQVPTARLHHPQRALQ